MTTAFCWYISFELGNLLTCTVSICMVLVCIHKFTRNLIFFQYDEADLPITRNQDYMMKNLAVDKSILARASKSLVEEVRICTAVENIIQ